MSGFFEFCFVRREMQLFMRAEESYVTFRITENTKECIVRILAGREKPYIITVTLDLN